MTRNNHYNPCFWTAYWNNEYYAVRINNGSIQSRDVLLHYLNFNSDKIYVDKAKNIHFEKDLGIINFTIEEALKSFKYRDKNEYNRLRNIFSENLKEKYRWDFENFFTEFEKTEPYQFLHEIIKKRTIKNSREQGLIATFIFLQQLRSHATLNSMVELSNSQGDSKLFTFYSIIGILQNANMIYQVVQSYLKAKWKLYRTSVNKFPLTDNPVLFNQSNIMICLSPNLMLEIERNSSNFEIEHIDKIPQDKLNDFYTRTINNTFRGIVFSDKKLLESIRKLKSYKKRLKTLENMTSLNIKLHEDKYGTLYLIDAHSNTFANE